METMGGSYEDALHVPLETMNRFLEFADIEQYIKELKAKQNAEPSK